MQNAIVPGIWLDAALDDADGRFARLRHEISLSREIVDFGDGPREMNRTVAWYGDEGAVYRYAGTHNVPNAWPPELARMRHDLELRLGITLNSCLVGWYDDGSNHVDWHADDEPELQGSIVSISLGATRTFKLRPSGGGDEIDVALEHGSVLVMTVESQRSWLHAVPPESGSGARMNLTFRDVRLTEI